MCVRLCDDDLYSLLLELIYFRHSLLSAPHNISTLKPIRKYLNKRKLFSCKRTALQSTPMWAWDFGSGEGRWNGHLMDKGQEKNQPHHINLPLDHRFFFF